MTNMVHIAITSANRTRPALCVPTKIGRVFLLGFLFSIRLVDRNLPREDSTRSFGEQTRGGLFLAFTSPSDAHSCIGCGCASIFQLIPLSRRVWDILIRLCPRPFFNLIASGRASATKFCDPRALPPETTGLFCNDVSVAV